MDLVLRQYVVNHWYDWGYVCDFNAFNFAPYRLLEHLKRASGGTANGVPKRKSNGGNGL